MLLTKVVKTKWSNGNRKHYESKGYIYTKLFDEFEVVVEDLSRGSGVKVDVKCDCEDCKNPYINPTWIDYLKSLKEDGKYYCKKCAKKLYGDENIRKTKLEKSISFEQWCYDNLSKEKAESVLLRWDYELNIDKEGNIIKPSDVCYSSAGFNRKGYWFKCLKHANHISELKGVQYFTRRKGKELECNQCGSFGQYLLDTYGEDGIKDYWSNKNTINPFKIAKSSENKIWIKCQNVIYHEDYETRCASFTSNEARCPYCTTRRGKVHPLDSLGKLLEDKNLLHLWSDKNNKSPYEYTPKSHQKTWWKCPNGIHEDFKRITSNSNLCEFRCPSCQFSKGEKRIEEYLINNKIEYIPQYEYDGLIGLGGGNLSYDFYLPQFNILIEYQGEFHDGNTRKQTKYDIKRQNEHDRRKKEFAEKNKINLLPIWYWNFDNIENILNNKLKRGDKL